MPLPPWLNVNPSDFLRAMQAGTAAGEAAARTAQAQWEAEQRLKLEEQRIEAARQQNKAQLDALTAYRTGELGLGQARLTQAEGHHKDLLNHQSDMLDLAQKQLQERSDMAQKNYDLHLKALQHRSVPKSPLEQFEISDTKTKLKEAQKALDQMPVEPPGKILGIIPTKGNLAERTAKQKAIDELRGKLAAFGPTGAPSDEEGDTTEEAPKLRFIRSDDGTFIPAQ